ncbi:MAG: tRNA uridine-5-carboxymethylaminomethyl(34) synthesis GTPase MnmE [Sedimentisphaerales bacterium]|nr:tRNA uridine-5-carboxymethylaminomethyl(34) synthesis GTPase MnmE [Sedimentisphaerales bacterium]
MYNANDTIFAISSPTSDKRVIIRITGPDTIAICRRLFDSQIVSETKRTITNCKIKVDSELELAAFLYFFPSPNSYTGDDVAEIHVYTNPSVTETILDKLIKLGLRTAEPGEFTSRAYLNGRMDLAQAEAVNEIIVSSNQFQLSAAENLLSGKLSQTTEEILSSIMDCMSRLEAGLDFSGEEIEFISQNEAIEKLNQIKDKLEELLSGSIRYETLIELPSIGIAGAPNAGKSTLTNKLLGSERSIVSHERKTTRDVLTGMLQLAHYNCVLFDCAGLIVEPENILDELAQQSAIEALRNSAIVIFCVDISKEEWTEDFEIRKLINSKQIIPIATKSDMVEQKNLSALLDKLNNLFGTNFLLVSANTDKGIRELLEKIDSILSSHISNTESPLALVSRHKKAITDAITNISESIEELKNGNDEVCTMTLRAAYKEISQIEQHNLDDQILNQIFSRFCIGK